MSIDFILREAIALGVVLLVMGLVVTRKSFLERPAKEKRRAYWIFFFMIVLCVIGAPLPDLLRNSRMHWVDWFARCAYTATWILAATMFWLAFCVAVQKKFISSRIGTATRRGQWNGAWWFVVTNIISGAVYLLFAIWILRYEIPFVSWANPLAILLAGYVAAIMGYQRLSK